MINHHKHAALKFWSSLKEGYDYFETTRQLPQVAVCDRKYVVNPKWRGGIQPAKLDSERACPAYDVLPPEPFKPAAAGQVADAATVVVAGTRGTAETPGFNPDHVVYKELRILGALGVDVTAYRSALDLLASARYPFESLPRECAGFDRIEALIQTLAGERAGMAPVHGVFVPG